MFIHPRAYGLTSVTVKPLALNFYIIDLITCLDPMFFLVIRASSRSTKQTNCTEFCTFGARVSYGAAKLGKINEEYHLAQL